jgi:peroxiredoxin
MRLLIMDGDRTTEVDARRDRAELLVSRAAVLAATGWTVESHGLCRGAVCNPARLGDHVSVTQLAQALHRPLAVEATGEPAVAVLGEAGGQTVQVGEQVPEMALCDVDGRRVTITGSGRKTAIVAWATWCGCRYELPAWKALSDELSADGLSVVTVAMDDDPDAVRPWAEGTDIPVALDPEHRLSDLFGVVNVPSTVWLDEDDRVTKPPSIAPGDDQFVEYSLVPAGDHHEALRRWVRSGELPRRADRAGDDEQLRMARAERRLAAWLHRDGRIAEAERHYERAVGLAPLDFTIRRGSMPRRGQNPFGTEFFELWEQWETAGRPGYEA